jgi:hypothetical protein
VCSCEYEGGSHAAAARLHVHVLVG